MGLTATSGTDSLWIEPMALRITLQTPHIGRTALAALLIFHIIVFGLYRYLDQGQEVWDSAAHIAHSAKLAGVLRAAVSQPTDHISDTGWNIDSRWVGAEIP